VIVASFSFLVQPGVAFGEGTSAADEPSRTINAANYTYCRTVTSNNNGYTNGIGTTTPLLFPLFASSTISSLAATSSSGRIQLVSADAGQFTDAPIDIVFTDEASCSFSTSIDAIPHYFEKYASTTGEFSVHLGTSNISSTTAKTLAMYYGNSGATNLNSPGQTFGTSSAMGIVSHWDLSVPGYATTTSPDFTDSTYNNNHGSSANMNNADLVSGQVDGSLDFDGTDDNVTIGAITTVGSGGLSFSFWIKLTASPSKWDSPLGKTATTNWADGWLTWFEPAVSALNFDIEGESVNKAAVSYPATDRSWHHIVGTWDGTTINLYQDAIVGGTTDTYTGSIVDTGILYIGHTLGGASDRNAPAIVDDVRIYNRALSVADIQTIYNTTSKSDVFWTFGNEETQAAESAATPPRAMRLFKGFRIQIRSGQLIIRPG